jgi:hypothetical protein
MGLAKAAEALLALLAVLVAAGCAGLGAAKELRSGQGPTAREMFHYRVVAETGRGPTFEERQHWEDQLEHRIARFLTEHPEIANAYDVVMFRHHRQVMVGMTRDQVLILLGVPDTTTADPAEMERLARRFWPQLKERVKEVWLYPPGWRLYFAGPRLVDITQYLP